MSKLTKEQEEGLRWAMQKAFCMARDQPETESVEDALKEQGVSWERWLEFYYDYVRTVEDNQEEEKASILVSPRQKPNQPTGDRREHLKRWRG